MLQSPLCLEDLITIYEPITKPVPFIFDTPHSGLLLPDDFHFDCSREDITATADHYVDELFSFAPRLGAALMAVQVSRAYLDLNRSIDDLDPLLLEDIPPEILNNPPADFRSPYGYGAIRRLCQKGKPVQKGKIPLPNWQRRLFYYRKIMENFQNRMEKLRQTFPILTPIIHINCHSMPSRVAMTAAQDGLWSQSVDICLGNLGGISDRGNLGTPSTYPEIMDHLSASPEITRHLFELCKIKGYRVSLNNPYKGAEILRRFGRPAAGIHSIQIEINKSLYMNEKTGEKYNGFNKLQDDLESIFKDFIQKFEL